MNKAELKKAILHELNNIHKQALSATQTAINDATDEETVSEHKYDTLALEASYLAHGQAVRVQECEQDIRAYQALVMKEMTEQGRISLSSLVTLIDEDEKTAHFFVGPSAGGVTFEFLDMKISIVTPNAPLGRAMMGKTQEEDVELILGNKTVCYEVARIV